MHCRIYNDNKLWIQVPVFEPYCVVIVDGLSGIQVEGNKPEAADMENQ